MRIFKKKNKLNPGVFGTKSVLDKIVFSVSLILLLIIAFVQLYLLCWMLYTSLKDDIDLYISMFALPKWNALRWENYVNVVSLIRVSLYVPGEGYINFGLGQLLGNSVLLALLLPLQGQIVTTVTAYIFAKYRFVGRKLMLNINLFVIIFPIVGGLASSLQVSHFLGRYDNLLMMCITGAHPFTGLGLLIQMGFYEAIPKEMMEAAQIDGANHWQTFINIHFPVILPTFFLYYMLAIFGSWNDYQTPLVWLPSYPNVALGIYQFQYDAAKYAATLPQVLAGFVYMSIPTVVFYFLNQELLTSRMVMAGLKE